MNELIKMGYTVVQIGMIALILTLVWTLWPIIMALLGLVGAYYLIATVLRICGITRESKEEQR